eukprot:7078824-Alexandrium_andersonii.AAC.1
MGPSSRRSPSSGRQGATRANIASKYFQQLPAASSTFPALAQPLPQHFRVSSGGSAPRRCPKMLT